SEEVVSPVAMPEAGSVGAQAWNEVLAGAGEGLGFLTGAVQNTAGELESVFHNWAKQQGPDMSQAQAATFPESAHDAGDAMLGAGVTLQNIRVELGLLDENAVHSPELDATVAGQFAETFAQQYPGIWQGLDQAGRDQLLAAAKAQQAPLDTTHRLDQWMDAQKAASPEILGSSPDVHSTDDLASGEDTEVRLEFDPQTFQQAATELTQQLALAGAHTELP